MHIYSLYECLQSKLHNQQFSHLKDFYHKPLTVINALFVRCNNIKDQQKLQLRQIAPKLQLQHFLEMMKRLISEFLVKYSQDGELKEVLEEFCEGYYVELIRDAENFPDSIQISQTVQTFQFLESLQI